jgi:hypothetical protein
MKVSFADHCWTVVSSELGRQFAKIWPRSGSMKRGWYDAMSASMAVDRNLRWSGGGRASGTAASALQQRVSARARSIFGVM